MHRAAIAILIALLALAPVSCSSASDESKSNEELARELLELTGGVAMAEQVMQTLSAQMRPMFPSVPEEFWMELTESAGTNELSELVVPIYIKHYSHEDLTGLLTFYRTPLGQRMIKSSPAIMQESMAVGGAWGQRKAAEIVERLKAQGYSPSGI